MITHFSHSHKQRLVELRPWISALAISYVMIGHLAGVACCLSAHPALHVPGILLLAHTTVMSGLLNHELMHRAVFRRARTNDWFGAVLSIFNGGCYVQFDLLRRQHMAHHLHKVGYDSFSVTEWVRTLPTLAQAVFVAMEYCYFPVLSLLSRARALLYPFFNTKYASMRLRIALVFCARMAFLCGLYVIQPWSILSFAVAHLVMITMFRLFDCYHHTFDVVPLGSRPPGHPDGYEQERTFSSLLSREHPWFNALFLNYGYHNAHHQLFAAPWYRLPEIDRHMFGGAAPHHILLGEWLRGYHRHRITRIYEGIGRPTARDGRLTTDSFHGIIMNLSFMDYDYNDT